MLHQPRHAHVCHNTTLPSPCASDYKIAYLLESTHATFIANCAMIQEKLDCIVAEARWRPVHGSVVDEDLA